VVTAAATIMVVVFASFVPTDDALIKPIAFALAAGVLIDAFAVRLTLVPAILALLGRHAWRLPRKLDAILPRVNIEGTQEEAPEQRPKELVSA
jgi:RND superfamily putative drug exporter